MRNNSLGLKPAIKWLLFFALLTGTALAAPPTGYKLVFTDEFNSDSLDTLRWIDRYPWGRTHNHDAYVAPENVLLGDGTLTLRAERRAQGGKPFTSGTISSGYNKYTFNGGYAEARILLPETPGSWPAFWGLYTGWPPEADIMEYPIRAVGTQGYLDTEYNTAWHYSGASGPTSAAGGPVNPSGVGDLGAGVYHTFGMEWLEDDYVGFYFDGQLVRSFGDNAAIAQMQSMYLIFNYAVGGWPGSPSLAQWPQGHTDDYKVDWVRVWQKNVAKTTTLVDPQDDGVADWSDNAAWTSGAPSQAEHNATLGPQATAAQRLDWSGIKTLGSLRFAGATSHTVGNGDESILFARDQATGVASLIVEAGSVAQIVNSRVETWSNLTIRNDSAARLSLFGEIHSQGPDASSGILTFGGSGEVYLGAAVRQRSDTSLRDNSRVILARGFYQSPVVEANATLRISDGSALVVRTLHSPVITGEPTTGSSLGFLGPGRDRLVLNNGTLEVLASTSTARGFTIGVGGATLAPSSGGTLQFLRPVALGSDTVQALGGNLNLGGAGIGVFDKILPGAGGVRKFGTSVWTLSNQNTYAGPTVVEAGQLRVDGATGSGATSVAAGALLTGSGLIRGALQVSGEIRPDGQLSVGGAATLSAAALLRVGVAAGGAVDRLSVAGLFDPTGATFQLDFDAGYAPQAGEQYDVIDAASWSGQFTQLSLPQLSASFTWDLADFSTQGVLSIGLAGDYNRDGQVDAADYAVWRDAADAGATSLPNRVTGGVGVIGQADYFAWATNFGASVSQLVRQGALIPEAAAARMALLSIAFFAALARR